jgi:hypothetical protein
MMSSVSELCHMHLATLGQHHHLRGHAEADQCCGKSLIRSALVRFGVRQHARGESISKRAPSTTRTSLRLESTICERSETVYRKRLLQILLFGHAIWIQRFTDAPRVVIAEIVSDLLMCCEDLRRFAVLVRRNRMTRTTGYANIMSIEWRTQRTLWVGSSIAFVAYFLGAVRRTCKKSPTCSPLASSCGQRRARFRWSRATRGNASRTDGASTSINVQHTPERFEFRQVGVG